MEAIIDQVSEILTPYKTVIGPVASVVTIAQFFAGVFVIRDIADRGNTRGFSSMPFVGGLVIGILMLKYSIMLQDMSMFVVNLSSVVLNAIYLFFYNQYAISRRREVRQPLMWGLILIAVMFIYAHWEREEVLEYRYGLIMTILMLALMGSPLLELKEIIRKQDASSIPLPITLMACIVCILWFLYAFILKNTFMIIQNLLGFLLCFAQLILYFTYYNPEDQKLKGA